MSRKSSVNHTVTSFFSIAGKDLVSVLADFCTLKKLAWSPSVKVAMLKRPAGDVGDAAWSELNDLPVSELHSILADLLKPVKQHDLFDLADWMRDISGGVVPEYLQVYWSNSRIPKALDELVQTALGANEAPEGEDNPSHDFDVLPHKGRVKKSPALQKQLKGRPKAKATQVKSQPRLVYSQSPADVMVADARHVLDAYVGRSVEQGKRDLSNKLGAVVQDVFRKHKVKRGASGVARDVSQGRMAMTYSVDLKAKNADYAGAVAELKRVFDGYVDDVLELDKSIKLVFKPGIGVDKQAA